MIEGPLRTVIVTSELTYVPGNYEALLEGLLEKSAGLISGVIFLKNLDRSTVRSILGLAYLGAFRVQKTLIENVVKLPLKKREKLLDKHKIPWAYFESMNDPRALKWVQERNSHLIVNARTRCIYREKALTATPLGCVNIHHGILPKFRGTMCDLYALSEGRGAGFSFHQMNRKIDDGEIFKTHISSPPGTKNYLSHLWKSSRVEGECLGNWLNGVNESKEMPIGIKNESDEIVFTKNPTRKKIKEIKVAGVIL